MKKLKMVLIWRKDLKVRKGKFGAMMAHAAMAAILTPQNTLKTDPNIKEWLEGLFTKIVVSVDSEEELLNIYNQAEMQGINCSLITDAGLTEFHGIPTKTAVAIGPCEDTLIDKITGHLKLL